jgi:serine/threonine protein kinase
VEDDGALIGVDVGGYVVERELGRGGMGVVYAATHPMIGKRAAIKVLKAELSSNPSTVQRFIQEARAVNQIGHPNIVDIFAFGTLPDGRSYLVMDLLEGEPLRKRVKRGAIPAAEAGQILDEVASALEAAHGAGFIHRDLKPDNVFIVANPTRFELKLLDFGLAKLLPGAHGERAFMTVPGAQIGTPDYMSPEQLRGDGVDHRTDVFALGILAFEILAYRRPQRFADGTFDLGGHSFKSALVALPGMLPELADLIDAMVAREPDQRPTLAAIRAVLRRLRPSLGSMPALSGVRPVASEMSIGAFDPSMLGAKPMLPATSDTKRAVSSAVGGIWSATPALEHSPVVSPGPAAASPRAPTESPALRPLGVHAATRLGVAPASTRTSRPPPVAPARKRDAHTLWLVLGALLVVGATIALVVVLMR